MTLRSSLSLVALVVVPWAVPCPSQAAEASAPSQAALAQAQAAFKRGQVHMDAGRFAEAIEDFRRAALTKNTPGLHFFIAHCLEQLGLLVEAAAEYDEAEGLLESYPAPDVVGLLPEVRQRLETNTPRVVFEKLTPGASVELDGRVVSTTHPVPVNPGKHRLSIQAPGHEPMEREFEVALGERRSLSAELQPFPVVAVARATSVEVAPASAKTVTFWTASGVAVAGLATGFVGLGWRAQADADAQRYAEEVDAASGGSSSACGAAAAPAACSDLQSSLEARNAATTTQWVGFGLAATGALTAVAVQLWWPDAPVHVAARASATGPNGASAALEFSGTF